MLKLCLIFTPTRWPPASVVTLTIYTYAVTAVCLWIAVDTLADRAWWATLLAFGPRWLAALPLVPLALIVPVVASARRALRLILILTLTAVVLVFGFMDYRVGLGGWQAEPIVRI